MALQYGSEKFWNPMGWGFIEPDREGRNLVVSSTVVANQYLMTPGSKVSFFIVFTGKVLKTRGAQVASSTFAREPIRSD